MRFESTTKVLEECMQVLQNLIVSRCAAREPDRSLLHLHNLNPQTIKPGCGSCGCPKPIRLQAATAAKMHQAVACWVLAVAADIG